MLKTKYVYDFTDEALQADIKRLINQLWKLIPMRENDENWQDQLATIIEEISGLGKIYYSNPEFLKLLSKLEGLTHTVCDDFIIYRRVIFKCIDLITKVIKYE